MLSVLLKKQNNEISLIVEFEPSSIKQSKFNNSQENKRSFIYNIFKKLDENSFKSSNNASELKDVGKIINTEKILIQDKLDNTDVRKIRNYKIDVFLNLSDIYVEKEILMATKYGIWKHYYGKNGERNYPPGFWEVIGRKGEIESGLKMENLNEEKIIYKSFSVADNLSVKRGLNAIQWKMISFIPRMIDELYRIGEKDFLIKISELNNKTESDSNNNKIIIGNDNILSKIFIFQWQRIKKILKSKFYFDQWILLYRITSEPGLATSLSQYKKILPPKDRFWADPHILMKNERYYIFIEELIYGEDKGFISVIEMDKDGNYKDPVKVLEEDYHLSYPFVFEDNGEVFMIPESKKNNSIKLYKCVDFPFKWKLEKVLMDNVRAVDTTIIYKDEKYWMFTSIAKNIGASLNDELFLFSSNRLITNNWKSNLNNPIVSDVKNARSAGKLFVMNDKLYRPSQNCSKHYGYATNINQVLELKNESYKEINFDSLLPLGVKNAFATHTLNSVGNLSVIDARIKRNKYFD